MEDLNNMIKNLINYIQQLYDTYLFVLLMYFTKIDH